MIINAIPLNQFKVILRFLFFTGNIITCNVDICKQLTPKNIGGRENVSEFAVCGDARLCDNIYHKHYEEFFDNLFASMQIYEILEKRNT